MSYFRIPSGSNLVLNVLLGDGATSKYPVAYVYTDSFTPVAGSPFPLAHVAQGLYSDLTVSVPDGRYIVVYVVYDDVGHTIPSVRYNRSTDTFDVNDIVDLNAISEAVWRELVTGNTPAGSFGEALLNSAVAAALMSTTKTNTDTLVSRLTAGRASNLDKLDATISSRATPEQAADAVWDELVSAHTGTGTFGKNLDVSVSSRESEALAASRALADIAEHDATQLAVASVAADASAIRAKTNLMVFTGNNIHAESVTVDDKTDYSLSAASINAVVDAIWDEALGAHTVVGSAGASLTNAATDVTALADAVWDEARSGHTAVGSFGESLQGVLSVARASKIDNLDATITSRESEASAASRALADSGNHLNTQAAVAAVSTKIGTPVVTVSTDIAAIKTQTDKIGNPTLGTLALDIANIDADIVVLSADVDTIDTTLDTVNTKVTGIKAKTDQLTFTGANVNANAQVITDKSGYTITAGQEDAIVDKVWDEVAATHSTAGTTGALLQTAASGADPLAVADAVWDELVSGHSVGGSFSDLVQAVNTDTGNIISDLSDGADGLAAIKTAVTTSQAAIIAEVNTNETKIDAIIPAISASQVAVIAEVNANETKIDAIVPAIGASQVAVIAEVNANEVKIDAVQSSVNSLTNNTTVRFIVPERLIKPSTGSKNYQFHLRLFDDLGNPEAPDSAPTIRIRRLDLGTDVVSGAAMTQDGIKVGAYYYAYSVADSSFVAPILVEATIVENGVTRYIPATSEITEFETDLTALAAQVAVVDGKVDVVNSELTNPLYGLAALQTEHVGIVNEVNANEVKIDAVKAKTDTIPPNPATTTETSAIISAVGTKPSLVDITTVVNAARDNIKGIDGRDNTAVYNHFDISSVAKTSDPRFANLDAAISSRSTLTAAQVWSAATRTLTAANLAPSDIQAIWDFLSGGSTVVGSIGKLINDNLDAKVSTRAIPADITAPLAGVAQETTLVGGIGSLTSEINANEVLLNTVISKLNDVLADTGNLPIDPASESALESILTALGIVVNTISSNTLLVKAKTDNLPVDPASEAAVTAIPTNPVLTTDARLGALLKLDVPVSSVGPTDVSGLATTAQLTAAKVSIENKIDTCTTDVGSVQSTVSAIKVKTDNIPSSPASASDVTNARDAVIARIDADGAPLTAADVWSNPTREITQDPASFGPDISGLATSAELTDLATTQYVNKMSTVFNNLTGTQEVIVWAEKNGLIVAGSDASVTVKDSLGVTKWTATLASPNADNIFRFENAISAPISQNYYIIIDVTVDSAIRRAVQSFFTVV